jgi:hypothetical protein
VAESAPVAIDQPDADAWQPASHVFFRDVVVAHFNNSPARAKLEKEFEQEHGRIADAFWAEEVPGGAALTVKWSGPRRRFRSSWNFYALHLMPDNLVHGRPEFAEVMRGMKIRAVRAQRLLRGMSHQVCLERLFASASYVLGQLDRARGLEGDEGDALARVLEDQKADRDDFDSYYKEAAAREARIVYLEGLLTGMILATVVGVLIGLVFELVPLERIDPAEFLAALAMGAAGAVVSVITRMHSEHFQLNHEVGREYVKLLGRYRPLIGAIFGVVVYFGLESGVIPVEETDNELALVATFAFLAGFSERFARDVLPFGKDEDETTPPNPERERSS